ncbi:unnamed protein product, partial [Gongylonema pulchrum]|uniref:Ovule protein n=1 Tax=Gongylonema pulchrum TaxID=637853 RepID=A0A183DG95_9BILA
MKSTSPSILERKTDEKELKRIAYEEKSKSEESLSSDVENLPFVSKNWHELNVSVQHKVEAEVTAVGGSELDFEIIDDA